MINQIDALVDFSATIEIDWTKERDLKRKKEAEVLILGDIPINCILGYVCYSQDTKTKLLDLGIDERQIVIKSSYYF